MSKEYTTRVLILQSQRFKDELDFRKYSLGLDRRRSKSIKARTILNEPDNAGRKAMSQFCLRLKADQGL